MAFRVPELIRYEIGHRLEQWRDGIRRRNLRGWINEHARLVIALACLSVLLLGAVLMGVFRPTASAPFRQGKSAWFYDVNADRLFVGHSKQTGPIPAPSGPLPDGGPAGFRAHVYSYVLEPNESELFIGFLERPDPKAAVKRLNQDTIDFEAWAKGRLVKRVEDEKWVEAASPTGQEIVQQLLTPNKQGQTPLYQVPGR